MSEITTCSIEDMDSVCVVCGCAIEAEDCNECTRPDCPGEREDDFYIDSYTELDFND